MAKAIVAQALSALYTAEQVTAILALLGEVIESTLRGAEKWQEIAGEYIVDGKIDIERKRSISAAFKAACNAKEIGDASAKTMFSRGTASAEIALGLRTMPTPGAKSGKKSTETAKDGATAGAAVADVVGAAFTSEVAAMVKEVAERVAHYQTHVKVSKEAKEAFAPIDALIKALAVKMGVNEK